MPTIQISSKPRIILSAVGETEKYCKAVDFIVKKYPVSDRIIEIKIRFLKQNFTGMTTGATGKFTPTWPTNVVISVYTGKSVTRDDDENIRCFFHEYRHLLQYDQGRYDGDEDMLEWEAEGFSVYMLLEFTQYLAWERGAERIRARKEARERASGGVNATTDHA